MFFLLSGMNPNKDYMVGGAIFIVCRLTYASLKAWHGYEVAVFSWYRQVLSEGF